MRGDTMKKQTPVEAFTLHTIAMTVTDWRALNMPADVGDHMRYMFEAKAEDHNRHCKPKATGE